MPEIFSTTSFGVAGLSAADDDDGEPDHWQSGIPNTVTPTSYYTLSTLRQLLRLCAQPLRAFSEPTDKYQPLKCPTPIKHLSLCPLVIDGCLPESTAGLFWHFILKLVRSRLNGGECRGRISTLELGWQPHSQRMVTIKLLTGSSSPPCRLTACHLHTAHELTLYK